MGYFYPPPPPFIGGRQPHEPFKPAPSTIGRVDNPPRIGALAVPIYTSILQTWVPEVPRQYPRATLTQPRVDNPPAFRPWQPDQSLWSPPALLPRDYLRPLLTQPRVDNPPRFRAWQPDASLWAPPAWQPPFRYVVQPGVTPADNAPLQGGMDADLFAIVMQSWIPQTYPSQGSPQSVFPRIDNPPPVNRALFRSIINTWLPADSVGQAAPLTIQGSVQADNPPPLPNAWLPGIVGAWQSIPALPVLPQFVVQANPDITLGILGVTATGGVGSVTAVGSDIAEVVGGGGRIRLGALPDQRKGETEEERTARRVREGTIPGILPENSPEVPGSFPDVPDVSQAAAEYAKKSAKLKAVAARIQSENEAIRAEITKLEAKKQTAKQERALMLRRQALVLAEAQAALVAEQLEVIDVAYVAAAALTMWH